MSDAIRDIVYALRGFRRAPFAAFTIVATVGLGLGLVTVAFTILNALVFRVDAVPDVHEMVTMRRPQAGGAERQGFTRAQLDALRRDTNVFVDAYAEVSQVDSRVDGRLMFGTFVTGNAFQVLRVNAAIGRALTPSDDEPSAEHAVIVLSHRGWERLFARDRSVLGRRLLFNGLEFEIVGVMPEDFRGLTVAPDDYWAPLSMLRRVRGIPAARAAALGVEIVGRLKPGLSRQAAVAPLAAWDASQSNRRPDQRDAALTLVPRRGTVEQPLEAVPITAPLFLAFGLILLIGCANVANLLLARAMARQREIGIQLSLGAARRRIIQQLLTENLLLALAAAAAGLLLSRVVLEMVVHGLATGLPPDIGDIRLLVPDADWRVLLFLVAGAAVATLAFALAPALQATRIEPLRAIRGELVGDSRPGRARNLLIGVQVSASALLLISAAVFLRSAFAAAGHDPGIRTSDTVFIQIPNEPSRNSIVQAVTAEPSIAGLAASWPDLAPGAASAEADGKAKVGYKFVSPEYFAVLGIAVVQGRSFAAAEGAPNQSVAIVSETAARALWPKANPIGQIVRLDPERASDSERAGDPRLASRTLTVAGVVTDVAGLRIAPFEKAVVYVPAAASMPGASLVARVHGDPEVGRQTILNRVTTIDPDMARQVTTLRTVATMDTYFLRLAFWSTIVLAGLALALTLSGLFSVLSYLVEQRTREIGVRMALGATARDVTRLVLSQSFRPVGLGLAAGGGGAAGLAALLLASPAAAGVGEIVQVLDPFAYGASLLIVVAACLAAAAIPAARAARLDPAHTLRRE